MPFDSQGNFTRVMNWQEDAANSVPIVASRHDDEDDNFAQGFNNTLCRDGRAAMTGALKMGNFKITGLGNGTTNNDAINKSQLDSVQTTLNSSITNLSNNAVKITGNQSIAGTKTFTGDIFTANILPKGLITLGTSANTLGRQLQFRDTADKRIARVQPMAKDTTNNKIGLYVNNANNSVEYGLEIHSDGYATAPTPATSDNSTKIATTAYVKAQNYALDNAVVKLSGNQTVAGTKTFSSSPIVPTPSTGDNSTKVATTAFSNNLLNNKIQKVTSLPSSPDANTIYFVV